MINKSKSNDSKKSPSEQKNVWLASIFVGLIALALIMIMCLALCSIALGRMNGLGLYRHNDLNNRDRFILDGHDNTIRRMDLLWGYKERKNDDDNCPAMAITLAALSINIRKLIIIRMLFFNSFFSIEEKTTVHRINLEEIKQLEYKLKLSRLTLYLTQAQVV
ncbi:unnamed protein product [Rotaria socialis]|uniref:Uncharacterized protein n=1 Tax=Rotaria socialis TaxID=392032 RepID=A0A818ENM0_9BILA|nr:unnamed protein product [Rotaria socialis]CAF4752374.1 unnamed protein product [Rotaria socialis]